VQLRMRWTGPTQVLAALGLAYATFAVSALLVPGQRKIIDHLLDIARMARGVAKSGANTSLDDVLHSEQPR
jgi:hypothetical protein